MKQERLMRVLLSPHMSEKATIGMEKRNEYVFRVIKNTTKQEVKEAIEFLFNAKVASVRIVNVKSKPKRFGKVEGRSKPWKKAYVTLQEGQQIDYAAAQ
jgi:large subunit ribosomal protein L23